MPSENVDRVAKPTDHDPIQGQKQDEEQDDVEIVEVGIKQEPAADDQRRSIPGYSSSYLTADTEMDVPDVAMELEASFSHKVPVR